MPELQGRFPIRVELQDLTRDDFARIFREPRASLIVQYQALLATEGLDVEFTPDAIDAMADLAHQVNRTTQNIGARRLHTILERVVEELSFEAPDRPEKHVDDRRRLRPRAARRARQGRGPEPVHPLTFVRYRGLMTIAVIPIFISWSITTGENGVDHDS